MNVSIKDKTFISVSVDFEPKNIISGQKVNVTTIISVEGDTPATRLAANAMLVLDNTGSMDPDYYAGTPADILLLSDNSGSMSGQIANVRKAETNFTRNLVSNDRAGLIKFSSNVGVPGLSRNITDIQKQINSQSASGYTSTPLAIQTAKNYLVNNTRPGARPIVILLSDGLPTKSFDGISVDPNPRAVFEAINESNSAKKTIINNDTFIKIYTIFFNTGDPSGSDTLKAIASPDSYYYATSSNIDEVYDNIAQQISDFDISARQYGSDGFSPYNYMATGVVDSSKNWSDTIRLDENVTDFKVQVDNPDAAFTLTSPDGTIYPRAWESGLLNRTGYYNVSANSSKGRYIWIEPVNDTYYPDQDKIIRIPQGTWTIKVITNKASNVTFNITTYIDKISAVMIASHAFISSLDATKGDRAGLVTYSNIPNPPGTVNGTSQSSYLLNGSTWDGYFVGNTPRKTYILNFTGNDCIKSLNGIGECYIIVNGRYAKDFGGPTGGSGAKNYSVDITDLVLNGSNTVSFYNYSYIYAANPGPKSSIRYINILENGLSKYWFQNSSNVYLDDGPASYAFNISFSTTFNLGWPNPSDNLDFYLYQGGTLLNKSTGTAGNNESFKATIYPDKIYYVEVNGTKISNETNFTLTADQMLTWNSYTANVTAPLELSNISQSFDALNTSIDTMTAVGLTAIDEGIYAANNEFPNQSVRPTMVLMTDGLDNAGYRSLLNEANRARDNNTVIYTIGFGNNQSEIDPVLSRIADTTGGQYYFAPNTTVLKSIFRGIASNLTNFTVSNTMLNLLLPRNYISGLSLATSTYIANSSNFTSNKSYNFNVPTYPGKGNAEPAIFSTGNISRLSWNLPNLTVGDKWGVWYQLQVNGAGYVPLVLPGSNITFFDMEANQTIIITITNSAGSDVGGNAAGVNYIALGNMQLNANPPAVFTGEPSSIMVTATYTDGNPAIANVTLDTDLGYFNNLENPLNNMTISGSGFVNFTSTTAGTARIDATGSNGNNSVPGNLVIVVKPKGKIIVS
ncbi:von Willebrand factor type A domain protein [uncultured archaeon]|nr:von Willebrand factor type A domain protein [uncultured archaeon]